MTDLNAVAHNRELFAALRSYCDDQERLALAAAREVAERRYAPTEVDEDPRLAFHARRWRSVPWLFARRVVAEGAKGEKPHEGPLVMEFAQADLAEFVAGNDPERRLAEAATLRKVLDLAEAVINGRDEHDADGVLLSHPIARKRMRELVVLLAEGHLTEEGEGL